MMKKKLVGVVVSAIAAAAMISGCAARGAVLHPHSNSQIKLGPKDVKLTKISEGKSCVPVILGLQFDNPSYYSAQQSGLESAGAEIFLDEISYEGLENAIFIPNPLYGVLGFGYPWLVLIYGDHCTYVEGHGANR